MTKNSDIIKIGFDYRASLAQFEKETNGVFDGISEKAGKQRISIQLDAKNDKVIEKIKELQKLKLDKFTFEFGESGLAEQLKTFDQLEKKITEIINLSKGLGTTSSPIIDVNGSTAQIDKLQNKLDELSKKYDELSSKKIVSFISGKDIDLVDNEKFKRLSDEFSLLKDELTGLKREMQLFEEVTVSADTFVTMEHSVNGLIVKVDDLIDKYVQLSVAQKNINPVETNISLGNGVAESFDKAEEKIESVNEKLQESKKFVNDVRQAFMHIVGRASDRDKLLEQFPELSEFKNRKNINNARTFLNTDEWKDFLSTLPQAHAYLESIGYDFERIYKLTDEEIAWFKGLNLDELVKRHWSVTGTPDKADYKEIRATYQAYQKELSNQTLLSNPIEDKNISSGNEVTKHQIDAEVKLNAEIEKREDILRELAQLQEKLTVGEDFHGNDRYFADALPTEKDIRDADARIKKLTGSNNIFDVDKLIEDRNRWLSEVRYSLEEYENLIKTNNQKALDDYTSQGLTRIDGAESFFAFEDNNFSIASRFAEEKNKIEAEIGDLYNDLDKLENKLSESLSSSTPIKDTNISLGNSIVDSKKELSNIIDISSKFNKSLDTTDKKYEKIKNNILTVVNLYKKMLSVNDDFDRYNEAYSKAYDYVKKIGLEQNVYWNKIWQGVKNGVENDNYDDLINGIYSGSIREDNSITEFNKEVIKLDKILQALYGKSINYKEVFLDIFNKLRDGAYSYDKALNKIQEDMNNKPSDLFNDMLYNEGLYPSQLKGNKPTLTIIEGQNKLQDELDETVVKINNAGKAYDTMAYRGIEAEEAVAKASKNYNGATHWSSDEKIARGYGDIVTSGNISLKNAFEVEGNGAYWDKIQILGDGLEENSKKAIEFATSIDKVYSELSTLLTLNDDFNKFNPGFTLYSSIGEEISKLSEEQKSQDDSEAKITSEKVQRLAKIRDLYADLVTEYDKLSRDISHPYGLKTTDELTKYAQANGYDGAIYKNIIDAKHSPIISGNEYIETSNIIVSFYENQVEYLEKISRKGQEYIRENISNLNISSPIEDTFQGDTEASEMGKVATAVDEAVQAKKDFATANEDVQDSVDGSKSKLELETELMERLAKSAREAADAKKEFVEANKQVQGSVDKSENKLKAESSLLSGHIDNSQPANVEKYQQSTTRAPRNSKLLSANNKLELGTELKRLQTEIIASLDETTTFIKEVTDFYDSQNNLVKTQMKVLDKNNSMRTYTTSYSVDKEGNANTWTSHITTEKIAEAKKTEEKAIKEVQAQKDAFHKKNLNAIDMEIKKREEESSAYAKTLKSQMEERYSAISSMEKSLDNYNSKLEKLSVKPANGNRYPVYQEQIDNLTKKIGELDTLKNNLSQKPIIDENDIKHVNALQQEIDELILKMNNMSAGEKGFDPLGADKAIQKMTGELEKASGMSKKAKLEIKALISELESGNPTRATKEILHDFYKIIRAEQEAGRYGKAFMDIFKDKVIYGAAANLAGMIGIYDIINAGREGITVIRELDTALTEMRKVSDETVSSLERFQGISFDLADDVGTTGKQIQDSTASWMRLGEAMSEASESAQVSNILLNVSEFESIDEATESLVAMSAAYKDLEKIEIVDVLNKIGNEYSISTDGIATALQDSASALVTANNDLSEAVALITAGNAVTQDPNSVGAGMRTISLRLVGTEEAKAELEKLGEDVSDMVMTSSKVRETIMNATKAASKDGKGFDILDANGNYKSTYEIMQGLADLYDEIVAKDKELGTNNLNLLLETIAGKNRANIAASILQNGDMLRSVYEDAQNSDGSAQEELDKFLESIDGKHLPYYIEIYN